MQCVVFVFQILFIVCGVEYGKLEIGYLWIVVFLVFVFEVYGGIGCVVWFLDVVDERYVVVQGIY